MKILKILTAGALGTTVMTAFSYALAEKENKKFEEPVLLNKLVRRMAPTRHLKPKNNGITGWVLHYAAGIVFTIVYDQIWRKTDIQPKPLNAILLGAAAGATGIAIWKGTYELHPNPPRSIDKKEYYGQLLAAHLFFGVFSAIGYRLPGLLSGKENDRP